MQPVLVNSTYPAGSMQKQARCAQAQLLPGQLLLARSLPSGVPHCLNCILSYLPEKICILPNRGLDRSKVPIFLGIRGGSCCLACVKTREGPSLQLEVRSPSSLWGHSRVSLDPRMQWHLRTLMSSIVPHLSLPPARELLPLGIYRRNIPE